MKPLILASAAGVGLSPASSMVLLMSQNIFTFAGSAATALKVLIAASTWGEAASAGWAARQAATAAKTTRFIVCPPHGADAPAGNAAILFFRRWALSKAA